MGDYKKGRIFHLLISSHVVTQLFPPLDEYGYFVSGVNDEEEDDDGCVCCSVGHCRKSQRGETRRPGS